MSGQSPYEQIRLINEVIKDRASKKQPTFFSVKLEQMGKLMPLVDKEEGSSFYETIIQYLTKYELSALIIDLFHGKSFNIKEPFQTFKIIVKRNQTVSLNGIEKPEIEVIQNPETVISTEKHFYSMMDKERQNILLEFRIKQLEWELEISKKKNKKKKEYIEELENELEKNEKEKHKSFGNIALGSVASNAVENFTKSDFGMAILKKVFGANDELINGLKGIDSDKKDEVKEETKSTASIITEPKPEEKKEELTKNQQIKLQIIKHINDQLLKADDSVVRLYYELHTLLGEDVNLIRSVYLQLKQQKEFLINKNKSTSTDSDAQTAGNEEEEEHEDDS